MTIEPINIVWLKRDLRLRDHPPLFAAAQEEERFLVLYCFEPHIMASPKHGPRHWRFVAESLEDLRLQGLPVTIYWGEVTEALGAIREKFAVQRLFSHQETGHKLSFARDRSVRSWCRREGVRWREAVQDGVIRGRKHRIGFTEKVDAFLARPLVPAMTEWSKVIVPEASGIAAAVPAEGKTAAFTQRQEEAAVTPAKPGRYQPVLLPKHPLRQPGGETVAWRYLRSFTTGRADGYSRQIGNPSLGRRSSSRMSTYLAWGCVSMRQVYQWTKTTRVAAGYQKELRRFRERLWWRAHYYQKLEAEWQIEIQPLNPAFNHLHRTRVQRPLDPEADDPGHRAFERFTTGTTGFPMIDASVRCLEATGWLNFRMRAMLVTFATFVLWLDWRPVAAWLSSRFLDYDPGIHYGQIQMQAGLTGYHLPRNYNPYKQGEEKDPAGTFVHRWLPELRNIPAPWCHYPYRMTVLERQLYGFSEREYPPPMVDYATAAKANMDRYWEIRHSPEAQDALPAIWAKHCLPEAMEQYLRGENATPRREPE